VPHISQQTKDGLIVAVTIGVGIATGFFVDSWTKHEGFALSLIALALLGLTQLALAFVPSKDMADLEEYRKDEMAQLKLKNAYAAQALKLAEEGDLSESLKWQNASAGLQSGRKPR
jgi:hypothetical protein